MATIVPPGEMARKAMHWISEGVKEGKDLPPLIEEAAMRFNLSPKDVEFLKRFYKENGEGAKPAD
jgi:hypothetical protein